MSRLNFPNDALSSLWKRVVGDKVERFERKEVNGSGMLECAIERAELTIWDVFCI